MAEQPVEHPRHAWRIEEGSAEAAFALAERIPEFDHDGGALALEEFRQRLSGRSALVLIACLHDEPVGFKAGYDRYGDGSWYSWMGGVLPACRRQGLANALLAAQEAWAVAAGFERLYVKTRNRHRAMLSLLVRHGYDVLQVDARDTPAEHRLLLCKRLRQAG